MNKVELDVHVVGHELHIFRRHVLRFNDGPLVVRLDRWNLVVIVVQYLFVHFTARDGCCDEHPEPICIDRLQKLPAFGDVLLSLPRHADDDVAVGIYSDIAAVLGYLGNSVELQRLSHLVSQHPHAAGLDRQHKFIHAGALKQFEKFTVQRVNRQGVLEEHVELQIANAFDNFIWPTLSSHEMVVLDDNARQIVRRHHTFEVFLNPLMRMIAH